MIVKRILGMILIAEFCFSCVLKEDDEVLRAEFLQPGLEYRMNVNRHHVPQTDKALDDLITFLSDNGYGGIATNVDFRDYMKSEEQMDLFRKMCYKMKENGFDLWLYDENTYPSGMAHPYIIDEHPEWEAEGLFFGRSNLVSDGAVKEIPTIQGSLMVAKAVPLKEGVLLYDAAVDLLSKIEKEKIKVALPQGEWMIAQISRSVLREGFQAGTERGGMYPKYTSLLMPEVTERFLELTHKRYAAAFKEKLGDIFTSTFTDEPSTMAMPYYDMGVGVYPWKENVSVEFKKRTGYMLEEKILPLMFDEGSEGEQLRFQYFRIISDFMSQYYFKKLKEYSNAQGLKSGGHLLVEETMMTHVPLYGSIMACFREMDVPGIDVLTGLPSMTRRYLYSSRLASSVSELNGGTMVMTEPCPIAEYSLFDGKEAPTDHMRGTLNRQLVGGVTDFNNYMQLMHEDAAGKREFNEYIARVVMMTMGGMRASRIAVYYPIETMWTKYRPLPSALVGWDNLTGGDAEAQRVSQLFDGVSDCLYDNGWEFTYVDEQAIRESQAKNGKLIHGDFAWDVLILPNGETVSEEMLQRLSEFTSSGGKVIALGDLPKNSFDAFPSETIESGFSEMLAKQYKNKSVVFAEETLDPARLNALLEEILDRDIILDEYKGVLHSHKRIDGKEIFFIINDTEKDLSINVKFPFAKKLELWNPHTGEVEPIETATSLSFGPFESRIVRQVK